MNTVIRYGIKTLIILGLSVLGGVLLLVLVFLLPVQEMKENAKRSTEIYDYEDVYPQLMWGYKMSQLDNVTDATMILSAIFPGSGNVIDDAMKVSRIEYRDKVQVDSLTDYANDAEGETYTISYPRYWHGYLVILKPLLLLFDVADIRIGSMFLLFGSLTCIILLMQKTELDHYILPFGASFLLMNPVAIPLSFQFSAVSYIMLLSVWIVLNRNVWKFEKLFFFFMLIGIATAYFDFLTFPLVGLYFPMIFILMKEKSWGNAIKIVILGSIAWIIGYAGMWSGKWLIGSVLTGENFFQSALARANEYSDWENVTLPELVWRNVRVLVKWPIIIAGTEIILWKGKNILKAVKEYQTFLKGMIPFVIIAIAPFVWYVAAGMHSYIHYWFTYRELCVSVFAVLAGLWKAIDYHSM